ncbi:hypothetical protein K474DRAFT_370166 [Panus rudis PR-1116 ss-1]|nr:hypothetical protein K474DRAFT_370166 [Panus rudis PR-1116 ss-1]
MQDAVQLGSGRASKLKPQQLPVWAAAQRYERKPPEEAVVHVDVVERKLPPAVARWCLKTAHLVLVCTYIRGTYRGHEDAKSTHSCSGSPATGQGPGEYPQGEWRELVCWLWGQSNLRTQRYAVGCRLSCCGMLWYHGRQVTSKWPFQGDGARRRMP